MELPIAYVDGPPEKYVEFCSNNEGVCELSGAEVVDWSEGFHSKLEQVNISVNDEVAFDDLGRNSQTLTAARVSISVR